MANDQTGDDAAGGMAGTDIALDPNAKAGSPGNQSYQQAWDGVNKVTQAGTGQANKTDFS